MSSKSHQALAEEAKRRQEAKFKYVPEKEETFLEGALEKLDLQLREASQPKTGYHKTEIVYLRSLLEDTLSRLSYARHTLSKIREKQFPRQPGDDEASLRT